MTTKHTRMQGLAVVALLAGLASLVSGCELILDFNRGLIDSGGVDATFFDAFTGDAGTDSGVDALFVPDAVTDVVFSDALPDAQGDAKPHDATLDGHKDGAGSDAHVDVGTHDAHEATTGDAHPDVAQHDGATHDGAAHDGAVKTDGMQPDGSKG